MESTTASIVGRASCPGLRLKSASKPILVSSKQLAPRTDATPSDKAKFLSNANDRCVIGQLNLRLLRVPVFSLHQLSL